MSPLPEHAAGQAAADPAPDPDPDPDAEPDPDGVGSHLPQEPDDVDAAVSFVLRSTKARPQTAAELARKLAGRGFAPATVEAALARAGSIGAVDDAAFARAWVHDRGERRGYARARLGRELRARGVEEADIDAALAPLAVRDEEGTARELAAARAARAPADTDPRRLAGRLVRYLVRRGYSEPLATRVALRTVRLDEPWD